ncbi:unnamed protein product [Schistosoma curassoni]|nr:unnamed protein product [Schistosoma curassoni]
MSYSTTIDDICNAVKNLPSLKNIITMVVVVVVCGDDDDDDDGGRGKLDIGISCDIKAGYSIEQQNIIEVTLSSLNDQVRIGPDGREDSFIHELARNLSKEAYLAASTNLKLRKDNLKLFNSGVT